MKAKIFRFNVPGTNVVRPLVRAKCGHDAFVPFWSSQDCTACYVAALHRQRGVIS